MAMPKYAASSYNLTLLHFWINCNSLLRTPVENHGKYSSRDLRPKVSKCNS